MFFEIGFYCKINKGVEELPPFFRNSKEHLHIFSKSFLFRSKNCLRFTNFIDKYHRPLSFNTSAQKRLPLNLFMQQNLKLACISTASYFAFKTIQL